TAHAMAAAMPAARLELLPGASHFGLIEYPEEIVGAIGRYLSETLGIPGVVASQKPCSARSSLPAPSGGAIRPERISPGVTGLPYYSRFASSRAASTAPWREMPAKSPWLRL